MTDFYYIFILYNKHQMVATIHEVNFYDDINVLFNTLIINYGKKDDILYIKQEIIKIFENINQYDDKGIYITASKKYFQIDENGNIKSV